MIETAALLLHLCGPGAVHLAPPPVFEAAINPALVCRVQHAILWQEPPWTARECEARAFDFAGAADHWDLSPAVLFAIAINESDLRTKVARPDRGALDLGLMAVRCRLGPDGRCTNKPVKEMTPAQVMRPAVNIEKGAEILATLHAGNLASYNGGPNAREHGYPDKIRAILAALVGVEGRVKGKRLRELVRRIARASHEPES
jgi:Transglycosylase SLT domain